MEKDDIKKYADKTYKQVSFWINNCDFKASILLTLVGVILTIAFTSDCILGEIPKQVRDVVLLFKGNGSACSCVSILLLVILAFSLGYLIGCIKKLLLVLYAHTDDSRDKDDAISISFYRRIGEKPYNEYKKLVEEISEDAEIDDKLRQVYDTSRRCTDKFTYYDKGLKSMKVGLLLFAIYLLIFSIKTS